RLADLGLDFWPEGIESVARRLKLVLQFRQPSRMDAIASPDHRNALAGRPPREALKVEVRAGSPGVSGMYMQVGMELHGLCPPHSSKAVGIGKAAPFHSSLR